MNKEIVAVTEMTSQFQTQLLRDKLLWNARLSMNLKMALFLLCVKDIQ